MSTTFELSRLALDTAHLQREVRDPAAGGYVAFERWIRNQNEGRPVKSLTYEAYEALALREGALVLEEALARFPVLRIHCVHRIGDLQIEDVAVWVGVSAEHREAAFLACRYVIDQLKVRVPVWKKEHFSDGTSTWVNCPGCGAAHKHGADDPFTNTTAG